MSAPAQFTEEKSGAVHDENHGGDKNGQSQQMVAPHLLKDVQGIAGIGIHEEHEVCFQCEVTDDTGDSQNNHEENCFGNISSAGANITGKGEHNGIGYQQSVNGEGVDVHQIWEGEPCPVGEKKGGDGAGDTHRIEEVIGEFGRSDAVQGNDENIYTAQMEGEILGQPTITYGKDGIFEQFIRNQQRGEE